MRYQYICYGMLLVLTNVAFCAIDQQNSSDSSSSVNSAPKQKLHKSNVVATNKSDNQSTLTPTSLDYYFKQFNEKNLYLNVSVLYGLMSDGGLNDTAYVEVTTPSGDNRNVLPTNHPGWGYQVQLGYKLDPTAAHNFTITYTGLNTSGTGATNAEQGGYLLNNFTQFGNAVTGLTGFHFVVGPATAVEKLSYNYQNINLSSRRPWADDGGTSIKFYKELSLRGTYINKSFQAQYNWFVYQNNTTTTPLIYSQDNLNYSASYYGIGPQLTYDASLTLTNRLKLKGGGSVAILAGFYTSNFHETADAAEPVIIGNDLSVSDFQDDENHPIQAWTPAVGEAHVSVLFDIINTPSRGRTLSIEGGIFVETILPLSTTEPINNNFGQELDKLNNSLNLSGVFITLNAGLD